MNPEDTYPELLPEIERPDKHRWETFENGENPLYPFPVKNNRYIREIVALEGNAPESVDRALRYYDQYEFWFVRAEAYYELAKQLEPDEKARLATAIYAFTVPLLAEDLHRHAAPQKYDDIGESEQGTKTLENVIWYLNTAIALMGDEQLIELHRTYLHNGFRERMFATSSDRENPERETQAIHYYIAHFEARIDPEAHCGRSRAATIQETKIGSLLCAACKQGFFIDRQTKERERFYGDDKCLLANREEVDTIDNI